MEPSPVVVDTILAALEQREFRSLRWGYVDGSLSEQDLDELVQTTAAAAGFSTAGADLVNWMVERCLLFEFVVDGMYRYRSRFAEGVRLLTRLKQLLPKRSFAAAPDLVSDYRIDVRRRRIPRRDLDRSEVIRGFSGLPGWEAAKRSLAETFIGDRRLSGFQVRATHAILRPASQDVGTVLTAGTGSGKTLAFYLPAALELGPLLRPQDFWTKAVAVFPRVELLKDQCSQAHGLLAPLAPTLRKLGRRPFLLGTFFSNTPRTATQEALEQAGWNRRGEGYLCPFLLCPNCASPLVWLDRDLAREVLTCQGDCGTQIRDDQIVLTRDRARRQPPDVLFTTAETMNQRLSDTANRHVLGISDDRQRQPRFLMIDEVHTYSGTSGSQSALVFRRWRYALSMSGCLRYVGLSATLKDAARFFSQLAGLRSSLVTEVSPHDNELASQSMEYQLVLRGDPASRTQLLSTTIQASFLMARLLDPPGDAGPSQGHFGSRVFTFTDDLDATNRLFDYLRDAEARDIFGNPDGARVPLAALRGANESDRAARVRAGQDWAHLEERLGRPLTQRLIIGRTSSQDRGVDWDSDIIVATAALEVGFNDPAVGAIIQHKSPHQLSAYVQRKGRAGRDPRMRPWTVTVLSDYGRDRQTFQAYDRLFDPILESQNLPTRNRYVLKMQAAFSAIDWLATTNRDLAGWWWQPLNGPVESEGLWRQQQVRASTVLAEILDGNRLRRQELSDHVRRALRLESTAEAEELLWGWPRPLLLEVIPTIARRLETNWALHRSLHQLENDDLTAPPGPPHPLPDFLPSSLFSDLNLPEVNVVLPPATRRHRERIEPLPIVQALGRLAPGRVTRRFASERGQLNHWMPVPIVDGEHALAIDEYADRNEIIGRFPLRIDDELIEVPCYRPWTMRLTAVSDRTVSPTSNGRQQWQTQLLAQGTPTTLVTEHDPRWGIVLRGMDFYLHAFNAPVTVRRFALKATATVKTPPPNRREFNVITKYVTNDRKQAAVGFEQEVDALLLRLRIPDGRELAERASTARSLPAWRAAFFRDAVLNDPELSTVANVFQREWLHQMLIAALVEIAISQQCDLPAALRALMAEGVGTRLRDVARRIFAVGLDAVLEDEEQTPTETDDPVHRSQLDQRWDELLANQVIAQRIPDLAQQLWQPDDVGWAKWLRARLHETLGEAMIAAAYATAPAHIPEASLLLDLDRGLPDHDSDDDEVWITETALGGAGAVEAIAREATEDPRRFIGALEAALAPSDVELTAQALETFVNGIAEDPQIANAVLEVRRHIGHNERIRALDALYALLTERAFAVDQGFKVAANHRVLRDGTGSSSDALLRDLVTTWRLWEARLGVAIDLRAFVLVAASHPRFAPRVREIIEGAASNQSNPAEAAGVLSGLLWPRTEEVRGRVFQSYGPFRVRGFTDPSLVRELLPYSGGPEVSFQEGFRDAFARSLAEKGTVTVSASRDREMDLHAEIYRLLADPVDVDYLQLYPVITEVARSSERISVTFALRELF